LFSSSDKLGCLGKSLDLSVITWPKTLKKLKDELCFREGSGQVKVSKTIIDLLKLTGEISYTFIIGKVKNIKLYNKLNKSTRAYLIACL
jgi:hypothetical protein